jgi:hypothetical protein
MDRNPVPIGANYERLPGWLAHPDWVPYTGTMQNSNTAVKESTDNQLREEVQQFNLLTLAERTPTCDVSGEDIDDGESITLCLEQTTDETQYEIVETRCGDHHSEFRDRFEIGKRHLVVVGRVGRCQDPAKQKSWPVLIAPEIWIKSPKMWSHGWEVSYDKQPTDRQDPNSGFKYEVAGTTNPSRPALEGKL